MYSDYLVSYYSILKNEKIIDEISMFHLNNSINII